MDQVVVVRVGRMIKVWVEQVVVVRIGRGVKEEEDQMVVVRTRAVKEEDQMVVEGDVAVRNVKSVHLLTVLTLVSRGRADSQQPPDDQRIRTRSWGRTGTARRTV